MEFDFTPYSDQELEELTNKINNELASRANLAAILDQFTRLNVEYLDKSGVERGQPWRQPTGAHDSYPLGWRVEHQGKEWVSLIPGNVWEPGVSGWREQSEEGEPAAWVQPTGAHDAYAFNDRVTYGGQTWRSTIDANVWAPGVHGWAMIEQEAPEEPVDPEPEEPVDPEPPVDPEEPEEPEEPLPAPAAPEWKQPTGAHDSYALGALVTYNAKTWRNTMAGNSYSPDVYGWVVVP